MDDLVKRAVHAALFFWLGLHGIGLGLVSIGADNSRNPIWRYLITFFEVEAWVAMAVLGIGVIVAVVFLFKLLNREKSDRSPGPIDYMVEPSMTKGPIPVRTALDTAMNLPLSNPTAAHPKSIEVHEKPKQSPEELKRKAISQILRG